MKKRIVCLTLALMMCGTQVVSVSASREDDLREEQAWTSQQLDATYARMSALWDQKQQLEGEIATLDANLVDLIVNIQTLETDISNKETEIVKTKQDLGKAQKAKEKQYDAMKKRIQYLYEKGGSDAWFQMMMNADNLADLLTRAEYTQKMYEQDRKSLEVYSNTIEQVKQLEEKYTGEKAELEGMKQEYEAESQNLQAQLDEKRATSADCENEIAYAQQQATEYANLLAAQQAEIEQLEAERIAAEEEARRQAEAAAAAQASDDGNYDSTQHDEEGNAVSSSESSGSGETQYDEYGNVIDSENTVDPSEYQSSSESSSSDSSSSSGSSSSGSGSGSSVVNYATQFVGNPYVWGGTSLTSGADCSGFVQSVYANFGVSLPRTSYEQQNAGTEVSYADAQPGDLICYGGHVAIYMGNGQIVHASNAKDGIKISNNAAYRTITSVRRLV